jgi:hypothetical protein
MAIRKFLLDANVVNSWESSAQNVRDSFINLFSDGEAHATITLELLDETFGLYGTEKHNRICSRAKLLLDIMKEPPLNPLQDIVLSELSGCVNIHMTEYETDKIRGNLTRLTNGQNVAWLTERNRLIQNEKETGKSSYYDIQAKFRSLIPALPGPASAIDYEEYHEKYLKKWDPSFTETLMCWANVPDPIAGAQRLISEPELFPYTHAFKRTHTALLFRYIARNQKVKAGDLYDATLCAYLVEQDAIVTNDGGLTDIVNLVWEGRRKIFTYDCLTKLMTSHV